MESQLFRTQNVIRHLKHYLPAQSTLKDFIHHNTLHAFQDRYFFEALREANSIFGYATTLKLEEYRHKFEEKKIDENILISLTEKHGYDWSEFSEKLLHVKYEEDFTGRTGIFRSLWKKYYNIDLNLEIHPFLFRFTGSYLDQGISIWRFPVWNKGFLTTIREMERNTFNSFFKTKRARNLLLNNRLEVADLLKILAGDEKYYEHYLFDQQFAHPGWSGIVSAIEDNPLNLLDNRRITLEDLIIFELLLEIDILDDKFGEIWMPLGLKAGDEIRPLFEKVRKSEYHTVIQIWQEALEWTYYDQVLAGIKSVNKNDENKKSSSFQALFCIDDREGSLRRYIEQEDSYAVTFGTPGFFGVEFFFKPAGSKYSMKVCPAPVTPKFLIKEELSKKSKTKDFHFSGHTHSLIFGWLITHTIGLWSGIKLFLNIFNPKIEISSSHSFRHMDKDSSLTINHQDHNRIEDGLQVGFTVEQMADRVEGLLKSIGLISEFAPFVYVVGHGASSVNNTHYAGYDCGACSGRPGSVNARVIAFMANHKEVRSLLAERGLNIPETTLFLGALHDTTRDEIEFFDENFVNEFHKHQHQKNVMTFHKALIKNAKERSRRFKTIDKNISDESLYKAVMKRSVSLFEPRPELNHATNALCIIGSREMTNHLFLDRRAFLNSYDPAIDETGDILFKILSAATVVCGGINLEYYFSRVDNKRLGAGTKLPHNVMGLIGVANGTDGDLRPGLPYQMIDVHDPLRIMIIVQQKADLIHSVILRNPDLYEWYINEWVHLISIDPTSGQIKYFEKGSFVNYHPLYQTEIKKGYEKDIQLENENLPVFEF
jgi:uncharacterized protein YbcC (UPF0753/DUF2309 family)